MSNVSPVKAAAHENMALWSLSGEVVPQTRSIDAYESSVVIPYDNGGGQKGLRENPLFKGYESLWRCYIAGMTKILDAMPLEEAQSELKKEEPQAPATILELVRSKHKKEA